MEIEKVILGLEHCAKDNCRGCPYQNTTSDCIGDLHKDVLKCIFTQKGSDNIKE